MFKLFSKKNEKILVVKDFDENNSKDIQIKLGDFLDEGAGNTVFEIIDWFPRNKLPDEQKTYVYRRTKFEEVRKMECDAL